MEVQPAPAPSVDQVVKLLVGPNSSELVQRHTHAISHLCCSSKDGFYMRDLEKVRTIMHVTIVAIQQAQSSFEEPMCSVLRCAIAQGVKCSL
jgi:hypothetical protein